MYARLMLLGWIGLWSLGVAHAAVTEEEVSQRVEGRWTALAGKDFAKAYTFLSPGYRETVPLEVYKRTLSGGAAEWTGADVLGMECREALCQVQVRIHYRYRGTLSGMSGQEMSSKHLERWIQKKGAWWYVPAE